MVSSQKNFIVTIPVFVLMNNIYLMIFNFKTLLWFVQISLIFILFYIFFLLIEFVLWKRYIFIYILIIIITLISHPLLSFCFLHRVFFLMYIPFFFLFQDPLIFFHVKSVLLFED